MRSLTVVCQNRVSLLLRWFLFIWFPIYYHSRRRISFWVPLGHRHRPHSHRWSCCVCWHVERPSDAGRDITMCGHVFPNGSERYLFFSYTVPFILTDGTIGLDNPDGWLIAFYLVYADWPWTHLAKVMWLLTPHDAAANGCPEWSIYQQDFLTNLSSHQPDF